MKRLWNCWFAHSWGAWTETHHGQILRTSDDSVVGAVVQQERACTCCGVIQIRFAKALAA